MTDWLTLTARAAMVSHRLVGWIYWDPVGIEKYGELGPAPNWFTYYIVTRAGHLADAGNGAVVAAFYSIDAGVIALSLDECREHTTAADAERVRDEAVVLGLREHVPEICDGLAELADPLWAAADAASPAGRVLFASLRDRPRPDDPLLSAWLAVNCIREWRGDTWWALQTAGDLGQTEVGILDGAWRSYEEDWVARSRGSDDEALVAAFEVLEARGLAADGVVNDAGIAHRQDLEDRLDELCTPVWQSLGEERTRSLIELVEPVGPRLMARIDETAGPNWMPAGRDHPRSRAFPTTD